MHVVSPPTCICVVSVMIAGRASSSSRCAIGAARIPRHLLPLAVAHTQRRSRLRAGVGGCATVQLARNQQQDATRKKSIPTKRIPLRYLTMLRKTGMRPTEPLTSPTSDPSGEPTAEPSTGPTVGPTPHLPTHTHTQACTHSHTHSYPPCAQTISSLLLLLLLFLLC